jgi:hypothetical protein
MFSERKCYSIFLISKYLYTGTELFHVYTLLQLHIFDSFIIIIIIIIIIFLSLYSIMYDTAGVPWWWSQDRNTSMSEARVLFYAE